MNQVYLLLERKLLVCHYALLSLRLCDVVSWQLGLVEREITELLQGNITQQTQQPAHSRQPASSADTENSNGPAAGRVPQREISEDDICPICQEELLASRQLVTFCRSDSIHCKYMYV